MFKVGVVVGSLRKDSINLKLAHALVKLGQSKFEASFLQIGDLALFSQDLEAAPPAAVGRLKSGIEAADAVLFVTPEYNRSIPGVLKNAIDWASRPYGKNSWAGKPAAIAGTSAGAISTAVAQNHLRSVLGGFLDMKLMGQPELYLRFSDGLISDDGTVADDRTRKFLQNYVDSFADWVRINRAK